MSYAYDNRYDNAQQKKSVKSTCRVEDIDILFCSTSCKDLSKMNANKDCVRTILNGKDTPGASVQTCNGLCRLMDAVRPDILIFENVEDMADRKQEGKSDLAIAIERFNAMGYQVQVAYCNSSVYALSLIHI